IRDRNVTGVQTCALPILSYLTFDMSLDELDINQVEVGQTVEVTCDSLEDMGTIEGVVTKVSVAGTTSNGVTTYPVTVQIDNPPRSEERRVGKEGRARRGR